MVPTFQAIDLDSQHRLWCGKLPSHLLPNADPFETLWALHPPHFHTLQIHGRQVQTPRWEQAYNLPYIYSGYVNPALPVPELVKPLWRWVQTTIDERLNGLMLTWYDGSLGHYIGKHRDSTQNMVPGAPIVTISLGEARLFRLRPWRGLIL